MPPSHAFPPDIPPDRADGRSSFVHHALVLTGRLGRVGPGWLLPVWIALLALGSWLWRPLWLQAALAGTIFLALDWATVALLPVMRRSWGPVTPPLLGLALVRALLWGAGAVVIPGRFGLATVILVQAFIGAVAVYATWIEPFRVGVTRLAYHPAGWHDNDAPLKILHISDIHFEGASLREQRLLAHAAALNPDLILLTGDYLNLSSVYDPVAQAGARELLRQLAAPLGVYAVTGSPVVDVAGIVPDIFAGLDIRWLCDEALSIRAGGQTVHIVGVRTTYDEARDVAALTRLIEETPEDAFSLLLYHTPDLMPVAQALGVDLYLCGHTHGGQIRLPVYGALATSSRWGKRYEMGLYREAGSTLYVSRGLGMEGLGAPRARLLAPPEIVLWTVL